MPSEPSGASRRPVYADLHVHLGWAGEPGGPVKITAARDLTLSAILHEAATRKGIELIGVIDSATKGALADLERLAAAGEVESLPGGGLRYGGRVTLIPGAEIEVGHRGRAVHLLAYVPGLPELRELAAFSASRVKNPTLSTQRHKGTEAAEVVGFVGGLGGAVIPAHIFTPFKSALGAAARIGDIIPEELWRYVPAVELGLSSDTALADQLPELTAFSYLTNSDAHSLPKIGREYNQLDLAAPTFAEWVRALREEGVTANYGLDPRLGKYHRTFCLVCDRRVEGEPPVLNCSEDASHKLVPGVLDRIVHYAGGHAVGGPGRSRPPYIHQVPLQFVPGLGARGLQRLLDAFGTEMAVLHQASREALTDVVGPKLAELVVAAREGRLQISSGAGGTYGKVLGE